MPSDENVNSISHPIVDVSNKTRQIVEEKLEVSVIKLKKNTIKR